MSDRRRARALLGVAAVIAAVALLYWLTRGDTPRDRAVSPATVESPENASRMDAREARSASRPAAVPADLHLEGRVVDLAGAAVAEAEVRLASAVVTATALTDAEGAFAFHDLPPGEYFVDAATDTSACQPRRVALRAQTPPIVLRLSSAIRAEVTVLSRVTDEPVPGAIVEVQDRHGDTPFRSGVTDEHGKVTLRGMPPDGYAVTVSATGFRSTMEPFPPRAGLEWSVTVRLAAGVEVRGRVVDEQRRPVEAAAIRPLPASGVTFVATPRLASHSVLSDANGEFTITLDAGRFRLVATHPRYVHGQSEPFEVDGKTPVQGIVIEVESGASIAGRVVMPDGSPAPFAMVRSSASARRDLGTGMRTTRADADGRFLIEGLPRVPLDVVAVAPAASSETVEVDCSATAHVGDLVVELVHDGVIAGVVSGRDGQPIEDARVFCVGPPRGAVGTRPILPETTDASGRFACRALVPGEYSLTATRPYPNNNQGPSSRSVSLRGVPTGTTELAIVLPDDGAVVGRVRARDGSVPPSFGVAVDAGGMPRTFAGADGGRFTLDGLAPKAYQVRITAEGYIPRVVPDVQVPEGGAIDLGLITLARATPPPR